jgi:hypothetical protein
VIWRSVIVAGYLALAIAIGIAYGSRGLTVLLYFYLLAGVWAAFVFAWGWLAREAGRRHVERLNEAPPGDRPTS